MAEPNPPQSDWKPPLLGNKQPRPMGKPEKEWFDDPVRAPGSRPRNSDEPPTSVETPPMPPPEGEPPEAENNAREPHKRSTKGKGR